MLRFYGLHSFGFLVAKKNSLKGVDVLLCVVWSRCFWVIEPGCSLAESVSTVTVQIASELEECFNVYESSDFW